METFEILFAYLSPQKLREGDQVHQHLINIQSAKT